MSDVLSYIITLLSAMSTDSYFFYLLIEFLNFLFIFLSILGYTPFFFFFFNDTATTEIYTLSLHDALPISSRSSPSTAASEPKRFVSFSVRITVSMSRVYWRSVPILDRVTPIDAERKLRELSFLHEVAQLASSARDWDEMLRIVIDRTTDAMRAEVSSLYLLEKREGLLRLVATNGLNPRAVGRATLRFGEGITGWVANARVPLAVRDVRSEPRWKHVPSLD